MSQTIMYYNDVDTSLLLKIVAIKRGIGNERSIQSGDIRQLGTTIKKVSIAAKKVDVTFDVYAVDMSTPYFVDTVAEATVPVDNIHRKRLAIAALFYEVEPKKLSFSDEEDKYYLALVDGEIKTEVANERFMRATVTFLIPDGVAHAITPKYAQFTNRKLLFDNQGTAPTYPVFKFTVSTALRMIAFTHPNGKAIQFGYEQGDTILNTGDVVKIDTADNSVFVNGYRQYVTGSSQSFSLKPGHTEIGITVNSGGTLPQTIIGEFREAYL